MNRVGCCTLSVLDTWGVGKTVPHQMMLEFGHPGDDRPTCTEILRCCLHLWRNFEDKDDKGPSSHGCRTYSCHAHGTIGCRLFPRRCRSGGVVSRLKASYYNSVIACDLGDRDTREVPLDHEDL